MPEARARAAAWWSLGLSIVWLVGLGSLIALPLSIGALVGLGRDTEYQGARLAAGAGLVLSLCGLVLLAVVVASS